MEVETAEAVSENIERKEVEEIFENGESTDANKIGEEFATPTTPTPSVVSATPSSTPDLTPSRRSSRKKQSTFNSDFEYYTPGGRKIVAADEEKPVATATKSTTKVGKNGQKKESYEAVLSSEKNTGMQRKVAVRTKKAMGRKVEIDDEEDTGASLSSPEPKTKKTKLKAVVTKQKGIRGQKKKSEAQNEEEKEKRNRLNKTLKRKKAAIKTALAKGKKAKFGKEKAEPESSDEDEEETTPISQLKAKMAASKVSPAKVKMKQLAGSPLAINLMNKLKKVSNEVLSSPESLAVMKKRKHTEMKDKEDDDGDDNIPLKKLQSDIGEASVKSAGVLKRSPPVGMGLVKRTPSEIAVKLGAKPKNATEKHGASGGEEKKTSVAELTKNIKQEGEEGDKVSSRKALGLKGESKPKLKHQDASAKKVKKEIKKEQKSKVCKEEGESIDEKKSPVKEVKVKKDTDVIKTVKRTITTSDGRIIDAVVKVYRNGKKVLIVNGKEKILNPGKSKETVPLSKTPEKSDSQMKSKQDEGTMASKKDEEKGKTEEGKGKVKHQKKLVETNEKSGTNVDDLLKRGYVVKKKSHLPFGHKNSVSKHHKISQDAKNESAVKSGTSEIKVSPSKGGEKKERKRSQEGEKKKGIEIEKRRRSSSESSKSHLGRERSHSSESFKSERKKSIEGGKKAAGHKSKEEESKEEDLPTLVPISALGKQPRHKHSKPEHEVPMDMTMNDLFKPDGMIVLDSAKKEENEGNKKDPPHDPESPVKPQNLPNVLIEHQYSKPSSPSHHEDRDDLSIGLHQQDFDSVSHNTLSVAVDANLPDQFMEESSIPESEVVEENHAVSENHTVSSDSTEGLQHLFNKEKPSGRISILESLDSELKEGGSEFLIVGQVEIGRPNITKPTDVTETSASSLHLGEVTEQDPSTVAYKNDESKRNLEEKVKTQKEQKNSDEFKKKDKHKEVKTDGDVEEEDEEEEVGFVDDANDDDWEPDDSNTLYCICQKPHGNRFMICCDRCEEWYHGSCVGISKVRGQEMEDNEEEYICLVCQKAETTPSKVIEVSSVPKSNEKTPPSKSKLLQKCVSRKCNKTPRPGSVYCSNECIMSHAQDSLKSIREEQHKRKIQEKQKPSSSSKDSKPISSSKISSSFTDTVAVVETESGKIIQGSEAPSHKNLRQWLEDHPTFQVLPKQRSSSSTDSRWRDSHSSKSGDKERHHEKDSKSFYGDKSRRDSKESAKKVDGEKRRSSSSFKAESTSSSSSSKTGERNDDGPNQVRLNVRTALRDSLSARANQADDIMLSSGEIKNLALTIEEELFAFFGDTGHKYRTKYRSLIFNIKDQKNKGLFRKILTGKIKPSKLVQMSTEELASRELAKWREKESKHQLEMIEQIEKEALKESRVSKHVRKKTHKGEVEVEEEDLSIMETCIEDKKNVTEESSEENVQIPVIDTTDQHRAHLFDLNCKVCTGKIVPGPEEQAATKKQVTFSLQASSTKIISDDDEQPAEMNEFDKAEEIVREAMRTVQKTAAEVASSSSSSIVASPPRTEEPPLSPKSDPLPSPKADNSRRESTSSTSSSSSISAVKKVVVRSPDSALQSGLEVKAKFTPTGPLLWKGFVSMLDVAKFFTSAYRVSGPTEHITIPDTVHIMGRISPDHMWDYLSKIRQAGSKDLTVLRFIPGSDDEKVAYVHLYSYLNSRGRCGVVNNPSKQIKDFYVVPLASHSKIPRTLLPFDGPGLEENRPHMLIGILVQQRAKHSSSDPDSGSKGSNSEASSVSPSPSHKSSSKHKSSRSSKSSSSSSSKKTAINRDPRLAKLAAKKETSPQASPAGSNSSSASSNRATPPVASDDKTQEQEEEIYEPEYVPMPMKAKAEPVAEYVPTVKKKDAESLSEKKEKSSEDGTERHHHHHHHHSHQSHSQHHQPHSHHHSVHQHHQEEKNKIEDDSEPYSPGKEAEPYSPSREAEADEPYDPGDESLMDETGVPITTTSTSTLSTTSMPPASTLTTTNKTTLCSTSLDTSQSETEKASSSSDSKTVLPMPATAPFSIEDCVEKMACSNNPSEISSLMVAALSTASTPEEQQTLLVDLTKKVEERKIQLAQMARKGEGSGQAPKKPIGEGSVSSTSATIDSSASVPADDNSLPRRNSPLKEDSSSFGSKGNVSVSSSTEANLHLGNGSTDDSETEKELVPSELSLLEVSSTSPSKSLLDASRINFSLSKPSEKSQLYNIQGSDDHIDNHSADVEINNSKSENQLKQVSQSSSNDQTTAKELPFLERTPGSSKSISSDLPDALKALMEDIKGKTESLSLERRKKLLVRREAEESEGNVEMVKEAADAPEVTEVVPSVDSPTTEAKRKLEDELEARRILEELNESEKAIGLPGGGRKEDAVTSESIPETQQEEQKDTTPEKVPTIDELLEKLKKGGFKFPIESNAAVSSSSVSSSTVPASQCPAVTSETPQPSSTTDVSGEDSSLDVDLRTTSTTSISVPTITPVPTPSDTISMTISTSGDNSPVHPSEDLDERKQGLTSSATTIEDHDKDERSLYQDRDERMFPHKPKHPLDPRAFPPLPSDSHPPRIHPADPRTLPPRQYPSQQGDPFQPRPAMPKLRAQPPPPGTEFEGPSESSDIDMRNMSGPMPLMPIEHAPPPLPPQPPPPVPAPHGLLREHPPVHMRNYPHYASHDHPVADVDLRSHEHHHPLPLLPHHPHPQQHHPHHPPPHHAENWYHDRNRDPNYRGYPGRSRGSAPRFRRH